MKWPAWWEWDLEISPHLEKRMEDRGFTEVDLRVMLEKAHGYHENHVEQRYIIETRHHGDLWHVVVEPDTTDRLLVVITAYRVEVE